MKRINNYILEKFKISKDIKTENEYLLQAGVEDKAIYNFKPDNDNLIFSNSTIKVFIFTEGELEELVKNHIVNNDYAVHFVSHPNDDNEIQKMKKGDWTWYMSQLFRIGNTIEIKDILKK